MQPQNSPFKKEYNEVEIKGSFINLDAPEVKAVKSMEDIKKLKTFEHLYGVPKEEAEKELADALDIDYSEDSTGS